MNTRIGHRFPCRERTLRSHPAGLTGDPKVFVKRRMLAQGPMAGRAPRRRALLVAVEHRGTPAEVAAAAGTVPDTSLRPCTLPALAERLVPLTSSREGMKASLGSSDFPQVHDLTVAVCESHGWPRGTDTVRVLVDRPGCAQPTAANIEDGVAWLCDGAAPGDALLLAACCRAVPRCRRAVSGPGALSCCEPRRP